MDNAQVIWEETRLPGNVVRLINTGGSAHIHGRISEGVLDGFLEEITETPEKSAASNLFNIREDNEQEILDNTQARAFNKAVLHLLFTGIRCRKETKTGIAFLTTRVRKPDKDYWKKLRRLLGYLKRTIKLSLILRAEGVNVLKL